MIVTCHCCQSDRHCTRPPQLYVVHCSRPSLPRTNTCLVASIAIWPPDVTAAILKALGSLNGSLHYITLRYAILLNGKIELHFNYRNCLVHRPTTTLIQRWITLDSDVKTSSQLHFDGRGLTTCSFWFLVMPAVMDLVYSHLNYTMIIRNPRHAGDVAVRAVATSLMNSSSNLCRCICGIPLMLKSDRNFQRSENPCF